MGELSRNWLKSNNYDVHFIFLHAITAIMSRYPHRTYFEITCTWLYLTSRKIIRTIWSLSWSETWNTIMKKLVLSTFLITSSTVRSNNSANWLQFFLAFAIPPPTDSEFCFLEGECIQGLTLGNDDVQNAQECLDLCQDNLNCAYYTYYKDEGLCYIFATCPDLSTDSCEACFSGSEVCFGKNANLNIESVLHVLRFGMQLARILWRKLYRWARHWFRRSSGWMHWCLQWSITMSMVFVRMASPSLCSIFYFFK